MDKHPFDITEILEIISKHLSQKDRINCLRVSKNFHSVFISTIWKVVHFHGDGRKRPRPTNPSRSALRRYKHLIQELVFEEIYPPEYFALRGCRRLRILRVSVNDASLSASSPELIEVQSRILSGVSSLIAAHTSTLQEICIIMSSSVSLTGPRELWYSLVGCTNLRMLDLRSFTVPEESLQVFLQICARPLSLKLTTMAIPGWCETDQDKNGGNPEEQDDVGWDDDGDDDNSNQLVFTAPRHLSLSLIRGFNNAILSPTSQARIIRMFPNLKSLHWYGGPKTVQWNRLWENWALEDGDTIDFFQALSQNPWALQRLECLDFPWARMEDGDLARLLRQMSQLKALAAHGSRFGLLSLEELISDNVILSGDRGRRERCLSETIESLQLDGCKSVTGEMVQLLLTSCPNLRRFSAEKITVADIALGHQGHRGQGWVCYRMTEMYIYLEDVDEDVIGAQSLGHHVYSQLAKLTRLRKLNLTYATKPPTGGAGWRTLDLRLKSGLELLSGLKELTDLSFQHDDHQRMGVDEVVWMTKQWPALRSIAGRLTEDKKARRRMKAVLLAKEIHVS